MQEILEGFFAGKALRMMHTLGILELLLPEFHGIDALVIRDAYHRYTVDEHTLVVIDTLHGLETAADRADGRVGGRFGGILRDVQHPALLFLAALLHDTGKGRSSDNHALESARMAENVAGRLALDAYESELMLGLIRNHLEMRAALRRDIFDLETVRAFAGKVQTLEALRMLTLFTYADIQAVHPDALTPWKAENLWRLYLATASYPGPQRGRRAGRSAHRQGARAPRGGAAAGKARRGGGVPGGVPGAVSADTHSGAGADALRDGGAVCRGRCRSSSATRRRTARSRCWRATGRCCSPTWRGRWRRGG